MYDKKLGFGLMRLPKRLASIDIRQTCEMVDLFLAAGFTYFDTAYIYTGSEAAAKKALVDRYPRESYTLATKINAAIPGLTEAMVKKQFETSLSRTGAGYFDYYLLHTLKENNLRRYDKFDLWKFVREKKEQGLIRHYGFSFHDGPQTLDRILTEHPDAEFVQLQINYEDWENPKVASRANYEVAVRHGKRVVVMEPVKGGKLANPPREVQSLMKAYAPEASCASWAIRFAASLENVSTVLSGMSDLAQMRDNLSYMTDFRPLNAEEREIIRRAQIILEASAAVPCTACRYCMDVCPKGIPIPEVLDGLNLHLVSGQTREAAERIAAAAAGRGAPADCIGCKKCEGVCPQHIEIARHIKEAAALKQR